MKQPKHKLQFLWLVFILIWTSVAGMYILVYQKKTDVEAYTYPDTFPIMSVQSLETAKEFPLTMENMAIGNNGYILYKLSDDECQFCHRALPEFERYTQEYAVTGVVLWRGDIEKIKGFTKQFPLIDQHYIFDFNQIEESGLTYAGTPQYFLVDQSQNLIYSTFGFNFRLPIQPLEEILMEKVGLRNHES